MSKWSKVLFDRRRATQASHSAAVPKPSRHAPKAKSFFCADAIGSVGVLHRSGIGPAEWLRNLGVPILHASEGAVGRNLQDHLQLRMMYRVSGARDH